MEIIDETAPFHHQLGCVKVQLKYGSLAAARSGCSREAQTSSRYRYLDEPLQIMYIT